MKTKKIKLFAAQMIARWAQDSKELAAMLADINGDKQAISQLGIAGSKVRLILEGMGAGVLNVAAALELLDAELDVDAIGMERGEEDNDD